LTNYGESPTEILEKTYIVEAHSPDGDCLRDGEAADVLQHVAKGEGLRIDRTDDKNLFDIRSDEAGFFFDVLDPRFWIVHTMSNVDPVEKVLSALTAKYPTSIMHGRQPR